MRKKLVAGNWKMYGSFQKNAALLDHLKAGMVTVQCDVAVCVPYPFLAQVQSALVGTPILWGHSRSVSTIPAPLPVKCPRPCFASSVVVTCWSGIPSGVACSAKATRSLRQSFLRHRRWAWCRSCAWESLAEREAGQTMAVVARQLRAVIDDAGVSALAAAVVAYEPVWAIGTGVTASPAQAQEVHAAIRAQVAGLDEELAKVLCILYGGSVKPQNSAELFAQADIDGGLIGGAALVAEDFLAICLAAN